MHPEAGEAIGQDCWLWGEGSPRVLLHVLKSLALTFKPLHHQGPHFGNPVFFHHPGLVEQVLFSCSVVELAELPSTHTHCPVPAQIATTASSIAKCCVYWSVTLEEYSFWSQKYTHSAPHKTRVTKAGTQRPPCLVEAKDSRTTDGQWGRLPLNRLCSARGWGDCVGCRGVAGLFPMFLKCRKSPDLSDHWAGPAPVAEQAPGPRTRTILRY